MRNLINMCDDSSSDSSSERSLSPSPSSSSLSTSSSVSPPYPAFANPISIPLKSLISPPKTTSSTHSRSPVTPATSSISPHSTTSAFPSWPNGNFLTASPSTCGHTTSSRAQPSSRISDEDLLDLEELELDGDSRVPKEMMGFPAISWEATRQPPVVVSVSSKKHSGGSAKKRRRSSPLHQRKSVKGMSPIPEAPE